MTLARQYHFGEPMSDEDSLTHYGVKGMKWGVRRGKGTTGVSRARGATIDQNKKVIKTLERARDGVGIHGKAGDLGRKMLGEERWRKNMQTSVSSLRAQNKRLKAGKLFAEDRLNVALVTLQHPGSLLIERRS